MVTEQSGGNFNLRTCTGGKFPQKRFRIQRQQVLQGGRVVGNAVQCTDIGRKSREQLDNNHQRLKKFSNIKKTEAKREKKKNRKGAWKKQTT